MLTEFPRTAVIYPGCEEEARILMEFLADHGFECDKDYYIQSFREDYPELEPEEDEFFLCSVNDFIVKCGGKNRYPDFDVADNAEIQGFLFK